jgi:rod shape-determining protein MreC
MTIEGKWYAKGSCKDGTLYGLNLCNYFLGLVLTRLCTFLAKMNRQSYKHYLLLGIALLSLFSLPLVCVRLIRGGVIDNLFSLFKGGSSLVKGRVSDKERLEVENYLLRVELGKIRALWEQQKRVENLQEERESSSLLCRYDEIKRLEDLEYQAVPAQVIYRDPAHWSNSFWVDVGEETNSRLGCPVIQRNSPVLFGRSLVGVIDHVGRRESCVRLITDPLLKPSVRAMRGFAQNRVLLEHLEPLLRHLKGREDLPLTEEERGVVATKLEQLQESLSHESEGRYLAKGVLQGGGAPLWRTIHQRLQGIGFNYDVPDEEGPARELVTGKPIGVGSDLSPLPIILLHDLLVTTGLDGVFPPGLRVAEVSKIYPLREGAYTYEIEAIPLVSNLNTLHTVFIIPPLSYGELKSHIPQNYR